MKYFRVTKYNPANRNAEGHYIVDEWTCPSEVGKSFNGVAFTQEQYFQVEANYINAVLTLMELNKIDHLRVVKLDDKYKEKFLKADETEQPPAFSWWLFSYPTVIKKD